MPFIDFDNTKYDFSYAYEAYKTNNVGTNATEKEYLYNDYTNEEAINDESKNLTGAIIKEGDELSYSIEVETTGIYYLYVDYYVKHSGFQDSEFSIYIDDSLFLDRVKLKALWKADSSTYQKDSYGNEIVPTQSTLKKWLKTGLYAYNFSSVLPYEFELTRGNHEVKFSCTSGDEILLSTLYVSPKKEILSYEEYHKNNASKGEGKRLVDDLQAENVSYKNDSTPIPTNNTDINASPYSTDAMLLNTISNFEDSSQNLNYEFEISNTGNYSINLNAVIDNSNQTTFASIFIDGEILFGELMHYPFYSKSDIREYILKDESGNPFEFYLEKGSHILTIKIDNSLYKDIDEMLENSIDSLNDIYLTLKRIAGSISDNNKEWNPDTDFPGVLDETKKIVSELQESISLIKKINGSNNNFEAVIYINTAINGINGVIKNPRTIPNNYEKFGERSGSIIENLANAKSALQTTPLEIDRIIIGTKSDCSIKDKKNRWNFIWENIKKFFISFTKDYSSTTSNDKTLEIWVARSRQYVDLMQQLVESSDFKEKTGYDVKFTILADESKLILSNAAGISPDGVMGISNWLPYEMGIRDLTVDLTKFSDYGEVIDRFSEGAMISLIADGKGLALPETQDFYVMYYRKDIVEKYVFDLPNTWQDVIELLPELQRNGFNFYIPLSTSTASKSIMTTAPFIYQYGGNLFSDDGTTTTIDSEESINAIKLMTEMYTLYGLESQVANFFDSFRNSSLPIGVSTFDTYVKLAIGAPEISGKRDIALAPGTLQSDGSIARWQTGSAQSMCLIDKGDEKNQAGWELLKWWSSADVQTEFANRLSMIYGKSYIWNSANLEAFNNSIIFTNKQKQTILEQWEWMREIPRVPGWYMLERELSNSWNDIVLNAKNTRAVIEDAVTVINKELQRKLIEFGYLDDNGKTIKSYKVTTLESIRKLKNE